MTLNLDGNNQNNNTSLTTLRIQEETPNIVNILFNKRFKNWRYLKIIIVTCKETSKISYSTNAVITCLEMDNYSYKRF